MPARPQTEANNDARRPPVDSGDRPPRYLAKFEIDVSGCKDGSPPVYTLLPLSEETDEWKKEKKDEKAPIPPNQPKGKKGTSLSPIKLVPFGNQKKKDEKVTAFIGIVDVVPSSAK